MRRLAERLLLSLGLALAPIVAAFAQPAARQPEPALVQVLDVGQGDAILIRSPEGKTALIDGGPSARVVPLLRQLGVTTVDLVAVSHHHLDHYRGLDGVIREFGPPVFMATTSSYTSPLYLQLLQLVRDEQMAVTSIDPGDPVRRVELGSVVLTLLPQPPEDRREENNNSIGIRVDHGRASVLLTGDSEDPQRAWWMDPANGAVDLVRDCDVLKLAHHGSRNGVDPAWLALVRPQLAVVSLAAGNQYGHPHAEALQVVAAAGIPLVRTDQHGTITLQSFGRRFELIEGEALAGAGGDEAGDITEPVKLDLNTATEEQLKSLPGIGPALAQRIMARRPFRSVDELREVSGIGEKKMEELRPLVTVEPDCP